MSDQPHVWHYGLIAETWAHFSQDTPELPFLKAQIKKYGEPVLDLACGTGRVLLPLLKEGTDIDGCDISGDMLNLLRDKAELDELNPTLYQQEMHALKLPRKYRVIYICSSFGLAGSRHLDLETLKRCYEHLEVNGVLVFNIYAEYADSKSWQDWLKEKRQAMPEPWPKEGRRCAAEDGTEYVTMSRIISVDPLEQSYLREMRVEKWKDGVLIAREERTLRGQMHFRNEVELMLRVAGFQAIGVFGDYTDESPTADHEELIFVAQCT